MAVSTVTVVLDPDALAATASRARFGVLEDGTGIQAVTLANAHGLTARVIAYGAALQSLVVADRHGCGADIVLAYRLISAHPDAG